jgi:hypothetical protein
LNNKKAMNCKVGARRDGRGSQRLYENGVTNRAEQGDLAEAVRVSVGQGGLDGELDLTTAATAEHDKLDVAAMVPKVAMRSDHLKTEEIAEVDRDQG